MSSEALPLVSVITPTYNQAAFLEQTILSVRDQDYPHVEHIVVDGGSTDGTLDILKRCERTLAWVSEPDRSQADAINKGFDMARGSILAWLNSDDLYVPGALSAVVAYFQAHPDAILVYGDALAIDDQNRSYGLRTNVQPCTRESLVGVGDFIVQPAAFWRVELWRALGPLDVTLRYTLDYEYWMRAAKQYPLHYLPVCLACERLHAQAISFGGAGQRMDEIEQVARRHGGNGLPMNFRAEATANYIWQALGQAGRGQLQAAREDMARAFWYPSSLPKALLYLVAMLLYGPRGVPRLRLWSNRLRSRRPIAYPKTQKGSVQ